MGELGGQLEVVGNSIWKVPAMSNNFMAILASLLLDSFIAYKWYESSCSSFYVAMNTSLGPNFPTMAIGFSG